MSDQNKYWNVTVMNEDMNKLYKNKEEFDKSFFVRAKDEQEAIETVYNNYLNIHEWHENYDNIRAITEISAKEFFEASEDYYKYKISGCSDLKELKNLLKAEGYDFYMEDDLLYVHDNDTIYMPSVFRSENIEYEEFSSKKQEFTEEEWDKYFEENYDEEFEY